MAARKGTETLEEMRTRVCQTAALDYELDGTDLRVFLYLCNLLNFDEPIYYAQLELVALFGKTKPAISRAFRRLTEVGAILPGPEGNRASKWRLNPDYGRERKKSR
jgi:hypothetical protein